jgi:hypothetical protein
MSQNAKPSQATEERPQQGWRQRLFSPSASNLVGLGIVLLALAAAFLPLLQGAGLQRELDGFYAQSDIQLQAKDWPWGPTQAAETNELSSELPSDPAQLAERMEKQSFRYGIRRGLSQLQSNQESWQKIIDSYPENPPNCEKSQPQCPSTRTLALASGYWALVNHGLCQRQRPPLLSQEIQTRLTQLPANSQLREHLNAIYAQPDCDRVKKLLDWGLIEP